MDRKIYKRAFHLPTEYGIRLDTVGAYVSSNTEGLRFVCFAIAVHSETTRRHRSNSSDRRSTGGLKVTKRNKLFKTKWHRNEERRVRASIETRVEKSISRMIAQGRRKVSWHPRPKCTLVPFSYTTAKKNILFVDRNTEKLNTLDLYVIYAV